MKTGLSRTLQKFLIIASSRLLVLFSKEEISPKFAFLYFETVALTYKSRKEPNLSWDHSGVFQREFQQKMQRIRGIYF